MKKFYITNAIPYTNFFPHLGHTLEFVISDVIARYHRLKNDDVLITCGSDENGQKILEAAKKESVLPQQLGDKYTKAFLDHLNHLNVNFDVWRRATDQKLHWPGVKELWLKCLKNGDIYKKKYSGLYCIGCEQFYTKEELVDGKCPEHDRKPELVEEENYFFKLSKYQKNLEELIKNDELKVFPEIRKNETLGFIKQGLDDFSVSRPKERLGGWGIPVPDDPKQVMYVWFDALTIYMTAVGWGYDQKLWEKWWPADIHVIGKGIYRFHTVYWPAMLLSAKLPLPKAVLVHGYVNSGGQKMAKSLGNVVNPEEILNQYGVDAVRYFLLKEIPTQSDGDFTHERFKEVYNADLANGLGNLVARITTLAEKFFQGRLPQAENPYEQKNPPDFVKKELETWKKYDQSIKNYEFNVALNHVWDFVRSCDKYIDQEKPWLLAKNDKKRLAQVVFNLVDCLQQIAWLIFPMLPTTAREIAKRISCQALLKEKLDIKASYQALAPGSKISSGKSLFPRL